VHRPDQVLDGDLFQIFVVDATAAVCSNQVR
jgi:hypothetical protein